METKWNENNIIGVEFIAGNTNYITKAGGTYGVELYYKNTGILASKDWQPKDVAGEFNTKTSWKPITEPTPTEVSFPIFN